MENTGNRIVDLSFEFALNVIKFTEILEDQRIYRLADQLWRSGTSIGANIEEAQCAETRLDFIHKLKIAAKECEETSYWLKICRRHERYPFDESLWQQNEEIKRILSAIIGTSRRRLNNRNRKQ